MIRVAYASVTESRQVDGQTLTSYTYKHNCTLQSIVR